MNGLSDKSQVTSDKRNINEDVLTGYRKLRVWKLADASAHEVYRVTKGFPKEEQFGLVSQLRRAAISVAANLVEGQARKGRKELKQFVAMALGSLAEVEYLLEFSRAEGFLGEQDYLPAEGLRSQTGRLLWKLYESL